MATVWWFSSFVSIEQTGGVLSVNLASSLLGESLDGSSYRELLYSLVYKLK
jgi:hypothetical protein